MPGDKLLLIAQLFHYVVAEFLAGGSCVATCDDKALFGKGTDVESFFELVGFFLISYV